MTVNNFDWTTHALLFLHTIRVIKRQQEKAGKVTTIDEDDEDESDDDEGINIEESE